MIIVKYKNHNHLVYEDYANKMFKDHHNPTDEEWMMHKLSVDLQETQFGMKTQSLYYEVS
jgi:hypothetical protein